MDDETQQLGGNIELTGFSSVDGGTMIVLKKIVGNYAKKFSGFNNFEKLKLVLKPVHEGEKLHKHEVHGHLTIDGHYYSSHYIDHNVFVAVDTVLKKMENEIRQ